MKTEQGVRVGHAIAYLIRADAPLLSPDQRVVIANHLRSYLAVLEEPPDKAFYECSLPAAHTGHCNWVRLGAVPVTPDD